MVIRDRVSKRYGVAGVMRNLGTYVASDPCERGPLRGGTMRGNDDRRHDEADISRDRADDARSKLPPSDSLSGLDTQPTGAMGGLGGAALGAAAGSPGGPIGLAIGAIAGALGGWWAGHAIHAARAFDRDESRIREYHDATPTNRIEYDSARPAYQLGHIASQNPDYSAKTFEEVEEHVLIGWTPDIARRHGEWREAREYARAGYSFGRRGEAVLDREVPLPRDTEIGDAVSSDPGAVVAESAEEGEVVYPSELDALANGIPAEPGSEAVREFGISEADASREAVSTSRDETIVDPREDETRIGEDLRREDPGARD
jgi:hypothetical protein